ncbi:MAG: aspartate carbamoyltransferase catalytic subunit [Planctomycetota bacterium]|nr:aspartate carbamoyltransferase catalytic subunit [Planctomycetota bacterium]
MEWKRKDLLSLRELSAEEIEAVLQTAATFVDVSKRSIKKVPTLRGKVVVNLFFEPSTRTRISFELAASRLSADVVNFEEVSSSGVKGETLKDTARNIEAMGVDIVVVRHKAAGAAKLLADSLSASVLNAGDGAHEHPTQGLLDIFTIMQKKGRLQGITVAIVGDISHSRVARSDIWGLTKLGAKVILVAPPTLVSRQFEKLGCEISFNIDEVLERADVVNMLRIQRERQEGGLFPSLREYTRLFGLTTARLKRAKPDVLIMHPGPLNRGVEISAEVADSSKSVILEQVTNGLAVRMAVMYLCSRARDVRYSNPTGAAH